MDGWTDVCAAKQITKRGTTDPVIFRTVEKEGSWCDSGWKGARQTKMAGVQQPTRRHSTGMTMRTLLHLLLNVILKPCLVPLVRAYMCTPSPPCCQASSSLSRLVVALLCDCSRDEGCFLFFGQSRCREFLPLYSAHWPRDFVTRYWAVSWRVVKVL